MRYLELGSSKLSKHLLQVQSVVLAKEGKTRSLGSKILFSLSLHMTSNVQTSDSLTDIPVKSKNISGNGVRRVLGNILCLEKWLWNRNYTTKFMVIISMTSISMVQLKINAQVLFSPTTGGPIALMLSPAGAVENVLSSHSASSQVVLCHLLYLSSSSSPSL